MSTIYIKIVFVFLAGCAVARAQDPEQFKDVKSRAAETLKKGVTISGMAGANLVYYRADGIDGRNIPFNTLVTGNLNVGLFGKVNMPVSFSLSNQNINWSHPFDRRHRFMQPFNRVMLRPSYKGFTLHAGTGSMTFSPFTLAGHRFDGAGLEYKPKDKPFYGGVMYGNLRRAVRIDPTGGTFNNFPSYRRPGAGVMAGYRKGEDRAEIILFTAEDKPASLPYTLDSLGIMPEQNAVVSLKGSKLMAQKWLIEAEYALSGITRDTRAVPLTESPALRSYLGLLKERQTTEYKTALRSALTYRGKTFNAGLEYSRLDPGYRTLGAYFFANDLESVSGKLASQFLQGKLNVTTHIGLQQDNVQKQKLKTLKRWIGAMNLSYVPSENLSLLASYSNFTSFSNVRPMYDYLTQVTPYQALDTLNFRQVNENIQGSIQFAVPSASENTAQNLGLNLMLQKGKDQNAGAYSGEEIKNNISNVSLDYSIGMKPARLNLTFSAFYSASDIALVKGTQWGPSAGIQKTLGKDGETQWKLRTNITYSRGHMDGVRQGIFNAGAGLSAGLSRRLNLNLNLIYLNRSSQSTERYIPSFDEFTGTLGLVYNFSIL